MGLYARPMPHGVRARLVTGALMALCLLPAAGAAGAECQDCLGLAADHPETGWVRFKVTASERVRVTVTEEVGTAQQPVTATDAGPGDTLVRHGAIWRCDRYERTFVATATFPDGVTQTATQQVRTPSCGKRLVLKAGSRKGRVSVRVTDRWGVGDTAARVCFTTPGHRARCRTTRIAPARKQAALAFKAGPGIWSAALSTAWGQRAARQGYVRRAGKLRLLATGDSMIQYVDLNLKNRLAKRGFKVRSDARVSTGLSKPFLLNWPRLAKRQASGQRPDVTVVFIGANDGFPFGSVDCCGDKWVEAYAARAQSMMAAYSRKGRGLVYWLTLPAPRPAQWRAIYPAVNRALKRAAARLEGRVRIIDIAKVFTPGNRFRSTMVWHGRRQTVRQADGVHLSPAGASIAEVLIQRALKNDGVIG